MKETNGATRNENALKNTFFSPQIRSVAPSLGTRTQPAGAGAGHPGLAGKESTRTQLQLTPTKGIQTQVVLLLSGPFHLLL